VANENIPLATAFNPKKLGSYVAVMEKFDGVPIRIDVTSDCTGKRHAQAVTRSGKGETVSVQHLVEEAKLLPESNGENFTIVGEVLHPAIKAFKDLSGLVRKAEPCPELYMRVFDFKQPNREHWGWADRMDTFNGFEAESLLRPAIIPVYLEQIEHAKATIKELSSTPDEYFEGWIVRDVGDPWAQSKRCPGYQKIVIEPTVDLKVVGFEEAVCGKTGAGKGMVGRIIAEYKGERIGVGPGKLTHAERVALWTTPFCPRIAEIKYKRDPSYTALRQPTFQHWRGDKTEPNEE
jgi:hypothetical protein